MILSHNTNIYITNALLSYSLSYLSSFIFNTNNKMPIVTIDGNIGSGKSSIMRYINMKYGIKTDTEPIHIWQPFLDDLYGNKPNASFNMQVRVWFDRCLIDLPSSENDVFLMERSPYFQRGVFIPTNVENGSISDIQYSMLQDMYNKTDKLWSPIYYIYLHSNPDKCIERIAKRARKSEDAITEQYLRRLHELNEDTYSKGIADDKPIKCIYVEGKTIEDIGDEVWLAINQANIL